MAQINAGQIKLNGLGYRIDIKSWKGKDMSDFAPRASTPGGSLLMSELGLYQTVYQEDWRHGFGWTNYDDALGYMKTEGNLDTRHENVVMLYTKSEPADSDNYSKTGMAEFNGSLYFCGSHGLRKVTGGVFTDVYTTAAVRSVLATSTYLFFCPVSGRVKKMDTAGTITDAGIGSTTQNFGQLIIFEGYIFGFVYGTNRVHYTDQADLSTLEGTTSDPNYTTAGSGGFPILSLVAYASKLYAFCADGIRVLSDDKKVWRKVLGYAQSSSNFAGIAEYNGMLYYAVRNTIYSWNGARFADATPKKLTDTFPYMAYGGFRNFVALDGFLYCTAMTNETTPMESLLCFDGASWHKLKDIHQTAGMSCSLLAFDSINLRIWYHLTSAGANNTYYVQLQAGSVLPYSSFPVGGTHILYLSPMDMGFRKVIKSTASMGIQASNLTAARNIKVEYSLDGGAWVTWSTVTANGVTSLYMPNNLRTVEYNTIQFRFTFVSDSASQSPILEAVWFDLIMRPDEFYGYSFNVYGGSNTTHEGIEDTRNSYSVEGNLKSARASKSPISLVDPFGIEHWGYVTSITSVGVEQHIGEIGEVTDVELVLAVNFVEIKANG